MRNNVIKLSNAAILGIGAIVVLELGTIGYVANYSYQFGKADEKGREAAMVYCQSLEGRDATAVHNGRLPDNRLEMYQKMQKVYQEVMGNRYNINRDPYINLTSRTVGR